MKRRPYLIALIAMVLVTVSAICLLANRSGRAPEIANVSPSVASSSTVVDTILPPAASTPAAQPDIKPAAPDERPTLGAQGRPPAPGAPLRIPAGKPIPEMLPFQKERMEIQSLASTYDAKQIPQLAAYLKHADAMVRDEARLGLIQLSSPEAAPVLREAAAHAKSAEEANALREAADFLAQAGSS